MAFKTFTAASILTASEVNTYLMGQAFIGCTSGTRPTAVDGRLIFETDTDKMYVYNGANWIEIGRLGVWTTYTPTLTGVTTQESDWTRTGRWVRLSGTTIHYWHQAIMASASYPSGTMTLSLPVAAAHGVLGQHHGFLVDNGTAYYLGVSVPSTSAVAFFAAGTAFGYVNDDTATSAIPHTWAVGDFIQGAGTYEAAVAY